MSAFEEKHAVGKTEDTGLPFSINPMLAQFGGMLHDVGMSIAPRFRAKEEAMELPMMLAFSECHVKECGGNMEKYAQGKPVCLRGDDGVCVWRVTARKVKQEQDGKPAASVPDPKSAFKSFSVNHEVIGLDILLEYLLNVEHRAQKGSPAHLLLQPEHFLKVTALFQCTIFLGPGRFYSKNWHTDLHGFLERLQPDAQAAGAQDAKGLDLASQRLSAFVGEGKDVLLQHGLGADTGVESEGAQSEQRSIYHAFCDAGHNSDFEAMRREDEFLCTSASLHAEFRAYGDFVAFGQEDLGTVDSIVGWWGSQSGFVEFVYKAHLRTGEEPMLAPGADQRVDTAELPHRTLQRVKAVHEELVAFKSKFGNVLGAIERSWSDEIAGVDSSDRAAVLAYLSKQDEFRKASAEAHVSRALRKMVLQSPLHFVGVSMTFASSCEWDPELQYYRRAKSALSTPMKAFLRSLNVQIPEDGMPRPVASDEHLPVPSRQTPPAGDSIARLNPVQGGELRTGTRSLQGNGRSSRLEPLQQASIV